MIGPENLNEQNDPLQWAKEADRAERAMMPHFRRLVTERAVAMRDYHQPVEVLIPHGYPRLCAGGRIMGLPIRFGDVHQPTLIAKDLYAPRVGLGLAG